MAIAGMILVALSQPGFAALMEPMLDGSFVNKDPVAIRWVPFALVAVFLIRAFGGFVSDYNFYDSVGLYAYNKNNFTVQNCVFTDFNKTMSISADGSLENIEDIEPGEEVRHGGVVRIVGRGIESERMYIKQGLS